MYILCTSIFLFLYYIILNCVRLSVLKTKMDDVFFIHSIIHADSLDNSCVLNKPFLSLSVITLSKWKQTPKSASGMRAHTIKKI